MIRWSALPSADSASSFRLGGLWKRRGVEGGECAEACSSKYIYFHRRPRKGEHIYILIKGMQISCEKLLTLGVGAGVGERCGAGAWSG